MPVLAIDLGGTKLATAVVSEGGEILAFRKDTVRKSSPEDTIEQIASEAEAVVRECGVPVAGAGLIVPGIADPKRGAWAPNLWGDADVALAAPLGRRIGVPLTVESDRTGYVIGEHWLGISRGCSDVLFVAVGTGIGVGILAGGEVVRGVGGAAGAAGWMMLRGEGSGCWESEASGPAIARAAGRGSAEEVIAAAAAGDDKCCGILSNAAGVLGMGVANLVSLFNPEMVVLGGGLMQAADVFLEPIRDGVRKWGNPRAVRQVRIELSVLGDKAGLFGAARLALNEFL